MRVGDPRIEAAAVRSRVEGPIAYTLALVFGGAAVAKMFNLSGVYDVIGTAHLVPENLIALTGEAVIGLELVAAILLLLPRQRVRGLYLSVLLSFGFLFVSMKRLLLDIRSPCHCFGDLVHLTPIQSSLLNVTLAGAAGWALLNRSASFRRADQQSRSVFVVSVFLAAVAGVLLLGRIAKPQVPTLTPLTTFPASTLFDGSQLRGSGRYVVIMFGDYQCDPCKQASQSLANFQAQHPGIFKFGFRNLPLPTIHPYAVLAARAAETARLRGGFWRVHDELYALRPMSVQGITAIAAKAGLPRDWANDDTPASKLVKSDLDLAQSISIQSTPTFIVTDDHFNAWQTGSVGQLLDFVQK